MSRNWKIAAGAAATVLVIVVLALVLGRDPISQRSYRRAGERVAAKMSVSLEAKYGQELRYTLDKFWSCYRDGACSRDDMTDVMERMRRLANQETVSDRDVFDLIGMISRIYTDRFDEIHRRRFENAGPRD